MKKKKKKILLDFFCNSFLGVSFGNMGLGDNNEFGFGQRSENPLNCVSPRISSSQQFENISETTMAADSFFLAGWDSLISTDSHHQTNHSSYGAFTLGSQGISDVSHLVQHPSSAGLNKLDQRLSCFESGSYPDTVSLLGGCKEACHEATNQEECHTISGDGISVPSPNVKKRKTIPKCCTIDSISQLNNTQVINT